MSDPEHDRPSWVEDLLAHPGFVCSQPSWVHFRQDLTREKIIEVINAYENGVELLHGAACEYLLHDNVKDIVCALTCLFVVGTAEDVTVVEPLIKHPSESVRKAAKTCLFEIKRRIC